jgi:hypothetical protein
MNIETRFWPIHLKLHVRDERYRQLRQSGLFTKDYYLTLKEDGISSFGYLLTDYYIHGW